MNPGPDDLAAACQRIGEPRVLSPGDDANCVAFSPDSRLLASGLDDHTVRLWDVETGRELRKLQGHKGMVWTAPFSPDGRMLASASLDCTVRLWEVETGRELRKLEGHTDFLSGVAFSPDGRMLASGSADRTVRLWEVAGGREWRKLEGHIGYVRGVAFSPDGWLLASGSQDSTLRLWDAETGRELRKLEMHKDVVWGVAFSPDGRLLASGSDDFTVRLWEVEAGRELRKLKGHTGAVRGVAFSPDGRLLASGSRDHTVRLWQVTTGQELRTLEAHADTVWGVAFSPDGRWLASASEDDTVRVWDVAAIGVGPRLVLPPGELTKVSPILWAPLHSHLRTVPLCHVTVRDLPPARPALWLRGAGAAGWPLPLGLARDLGLLLTQPPTQLTMAKPTHLGFDDDTSAYQAFLQRFAAHPLVRELPAWQPPLPDTVLGIVLARLVEGLNLPECFRLPTGPEGVRFIRVLGEKLAQAEPGQIWRETSVEKRPSWPVLLPPESLARIERNLRGLDRDELRFLVRYGTPLAGSPDPRDLLDLLALTGVPEATRLALSQTLKLLPRVSEVRAVGGVQTYPEGGYEGLARQGSLDSLLPSEAAYPEAMFFHRVLNHEALYYGRERPRDRRRELAYLVMQVGYGLGGDGQVLARALLLALGQTLRQRGYEVLYSIAGAELTDPRPLDKPGEVARALYHYEPVLVDGAKILGQALRRLRQWREEYRARQVLWVVSEFFDADDAEDHAALYQALKEEAGQQAWFVRISNSHQESPDRRSALRLPTSDFRPPPSASCPLSPASCFLPPTPRPPPPSARYFDRWQMVETSVMRENQEKVQRA